MSNTNWLLLLCLIISAVKHNFSSPSFSQHYSPLSHLSPCFPWLSLFFLSSLKLKLLSFIALLSLTLPLLLDTFQTVSLYFIFASFYLNSYLFLSFSSLPVRVWVTYPFLHNFLLSVWLSLLARSQKDQREGKMEKSKLNPRSYIPCTFISSHFQILNLTVFF